MPSSAMSRLLFSDTNGRVFVIILPQHSVYDWIRLAFLLPFWATPIFVAFKAACGEWPQGSIAMLFVVLAITGSIVIIAMGTMNACFRVFGREELLIQGDTFSMTIILGPTKSTRCFHVDEISKFRFEERRKRAKGHWVIRRHLFFEYRGRTVFNTSQLSKEEGLELIGGPLSQLARR